MSSRQPVYLIVVLLLAIVCSAPQFLFFGLMGMQAYQRQDWPFLAVPGFGTNVNYGNVRSSVPFWQDQFIFITPEQDGNYDLRCYGFDPETGKQAAAAMNLSYLAQPPASDHIYPQFLPFGDRLWLMDFQNGTSGKSYEIIKGELQRSPALFPTSWPPNGPRFLLNGEPAIITKFGNGFAIYTIQAGTWTITESVLLPDFDRDWTLGTATFNLRGVAQLTCLNHGGQIHVFLRVDGLLLYRQGLELTPISTTFSLLGQQIVQEGDSSSAPVSAMRPTNTDSQIEGWTIIRDKNLLVAALPDSVKNVPVDGAMLVGGQPAAMIVEKDSADETTGFLYRFNGHEWSQLATQKFPFGSQSFRAVVCRDEQRSYFVAITSWGIAPVYAVEENGIRPADRGRRYGFWLGTVVIYLVWPAISLVLGIVLGTSVWFFMWRYTKSDYEFGNRAARLASLGRRGLARLIDLALIVSSTAGLGWVLTIGIDWNTLAEALNLHIDHPVVSAVKRVTMILGLWLAVVVILLLVVQGRWGLSPGKWYCGLRTLRTTLMPCGFARSLAREIVFCVDACNFLCWAPGILSIALTECRQRLGDLVADTIVVEAQPFRRQNSPQRGNRGSNRADISVST